MSGPKIITRGARQGDLTARLNAISAMIAKTLLEGVEFALILFSEQQGYGGYTSSVKAHPIVVKAVRDCADAIEKKIGTKGPTGQIILPH